MVCVDAEVRFRRQKTKTQVSSEAVRAGYFRSLKGLKNDLPSTRQFRWRLG